MEILFQSLRNRWLLTIVTELSAILYVVHLEPVSLDSNVRFTYIFGHNHFKNNDGDNFIQNHSIQKNYSHSYAPISI